MIERAELPLQRKRTLYGSGMGSPLRPRSSSKIGEERRAYLRPAPAAIAGEEVHEGAEAVEVGAIAHHPSLLLGGGEAGADERRQMRRHGVVRHRAVASY